MKLLRAPAWLLLAGFTCLSIFGLFADDLFHQEIWSPAGLTRLAGFTILYAALALPLIFMWRARLVMALGGLAVFYTTLVAGPAATATTLLILLAAWSAGRLARVRFAKKSGAPLIELMIGFVLLVSVLLFTAWFRVHYVWAYLGLLLAPVILNRRATMQMLRSLPSVGQGWSVREAAAFSLFFYVLALHWLMALKPEISSDGLSMHLVLPAQVAFRHWWPFDFRLFVWAVMPAGADWAFTLAYLPGGESAARLLNFCFLAVTAAMVARALEERLKRAAALLVAALLVSTPLVQMETGNLMAEPFWAAVILAAVLALDLFDRGREAGWLLLGAMLAGFGLSIKFGSISFSLVILAVILARLWKSGLAERIWWMVSAVGLFLLVGSWPYVNARRLTGNPIFPFLNGVIRSPYFEPRDFVDPRFKAPLSWRTLYDVTFHSHRFLEGQDGALGFGWLWLLPVAVLGLIGARSRLGRVALGVAVTGWVATFLGQAYLRYVFPALPLLALVIGIGWSRLYGADRLLGRVMGVLVVGITLLNVYFISSSSWYHKDFLLNPFDAGAKQAYLTEGAPTRALVARINRMGEADPRVAFFEDNAIGELRGTPYTNTWHSNTFVWEIRRLTGPLEALRLFNHWKITWFIAPADPARVMIVPASQFLAAFAEKVADSGAMRLWRLRSEYQDVPSSKAYRIYQAHLLAVEKGAYDDSDEHLAFDGPWIRDHQFAEPLAGTVTYCASKLCTVELRFHGRELTWIYTGAPNRGQASIAIDGREQVVDQYSKAVRWRQRKVFPLEEGAHRVVIRVLAQKQAQAEDCFVDVDGLAVR
ncbi:MAG: glycosyltransferase family 39 protein [Bryobacterales bacterium]|nr:glycosyltransferase family 39 protein [Bryobacterales bacterium]